MDGFKDFMLHKWTLIVVAGVSTHLAARVTVLLTADKVQSLLQNIFVNPTLKPGASEWLKSAIGSVVMIIGLSVYHYLHERFVLPHVSQNQTQGVSI